MPDPTPFAAEVIVIHGALLRAIHGHCGSEVMNDTLPVPPVGGKDWSSEPRANWHADWLRTTISGANNVARE